jgi:fructokinase
MSGPVDVLSFGEALIDFFPERPGIPLVDCDVFHRHLGGAPCNLAVGLARLGVRAGLMTLVGRDDFGRFVRERLSDEGVDVRGIGTHASCKTGVTFVSVANDGARSFLFFRHPSADLAISPADVDEELVANATIFHTGSSTLSREPARAATWKALAAARRAGRVITSDPNWRVHLWDDPDAARPLLLELLAQCDLVKLSEDELEPLVGVAEVEAAARAVRSLGCGVVVVTLGERGCWFDAPAGAGHVDGERVEVVDTTGAGDGFVAGLLASVLPAVRAGRRPAELDLPSLRAACAAGNRVGAQVVTRIGATAALPRLNSPTGVR